MNTKNSPASCRFPTFLPFLSCVSGGEISRTKLWGELTSFSTSSPLLLPFQKNENENFRYVGPIGANVQPQGVNIQPQLITVAPAGAIVQPTGALVAPADIAIAPVDTLYGPQGVSLVFLFSPGACGPRPPSPPSLARSADAAEATAEDAPPLGEKSFSRRSKKLTLISKNGKIPLHSNTRSRTPRSRTTSQKPRQSSRSLETPAKKRDRKNEANPQITKLNKNFSRIIKREKLETGADTTPNAYELKRHY